MVYKKFQVYDWFKTLDGAKRIDFLNGMLHLCFPLELRFLGSCIEELARKDYLYLKDAELKANSLQEIQQFKDICDKITRSKMIVTLALLASNNYDCARLLFDLLNVDICQTIEKMKLVHMDAKIADEFLLLLTMAANHPAFDFQMKTKMSHLYLGAENKLKLEEIIIRESESDMCLCEKENFRDKCKNSESFEVSSVTNQTTTIQNTNSEDNTTLTTTNINSNNDLVVDNNNNKNNTEDYTESNEQLNKIKPRFKTSSSSSSLSSTVSSLNNENDEENVNEKVSENISNRSKDTKSPFVSKENESNVYKEEPIIESINFEGVRSIQGTDNYRFLIKIRWSDKSFNEIHKTYSELCEFNQQLLNLFPNELNGIFESSQLVFKENQKEDFIKEMPLVAEYCTKLAGLPKEICKSNFLRNFFRSNSIDDPKIALEKHINEDLLINTRENSLSKADSENEEKKNINVQNNEEIEKNKSVNTNNNICKSKNVVVSVATVMNQKQNNQHQQQPPQQTQANSSIMNKQTIQNSQSHVFNAHSYHSNLNKMIQFGQLPPQFPNPVFQQLHLQTFQPISSPPCASPTLLPQQQIPNFNSSHSLNNSRSSSPWMMIPPPSLLPPNNNQTIPNQQINIQNYNQLRQTNKQHGNSLKESKTNLVNTNQEELLLRYALDNNNSNIQSQTSPVDESNSEKSSSNNNNNNKSNKSFDLRKNSLKSKHQQFTNDSINHQSIETSGINNANFNAAGTMSPKSTSNNLRSSSSCSSTSYQTPPPQSNQLPININNLQTKQLSSPSTTVNFNTNLHQIAPNFQQLQHQPHHLQPPPSMSSHNNPHLIPLSNAQLISLQLQQQNKQSQTQQQSPASSSSTQSLPSLLLAPIVPQAGSGITIPFPLPSQQSIPIPGPNLSIVTGLAQPALAVSQPIPMTTQQPVAAQSPSLPSSLSSISSIKNQSSTKQSRTGFNDRSNSPSIYPTNQHNNLSSSTLSNAVGSLTNTSDDEDNNNLEMENSEISKAATNRTQRKSERLSNSSNTTLVNNNINNKANNNSNNISNSQRSSSSNFVTSNSNNKNISLTSPGGTNQQIQTAYYYNNSVNEPQTKLMSPASSLNMNKKDKSNSDQIEKNEVNKINKENENKSSQNEKNSSSDNNENTSTVQNGLSSKSPPVNSSFQGQNQNQPSQSIPISMNNLFYPSVMPPFIIDGHNLYTLTNSIGVPTLVQSSNQSSNLQAGSNNSHPNHIFSQLNSFQQGGSMPFNINPAHLATHIGPHPMHNQLQPINIQQNQTQMPPPPPPPFFIPIIPAINQQSQSSSSSNNINNNATPTPGSSPNPQPSVSQQLSVNNSNENMLNSKNQIPNQQFISNQDQQIINPYNFHMMAVSNPTLNNTNIAQSNNPQIQPQHQQLPSLNPNMFMMMMMGNPQGHMTLAPPVPGNNSIGPKQPIGINFSQFQQYHSLPTPPPQISPSINNFIKTQKKKSCYNCGQMNHTAYECKEPNIESITHTNQFRLNFKPNITNQITQSNETNTEEQTNNSSLINLSSPGSSKNLTKNTSASAISSTTTINSSRPIIKSNPTQS